MNAPEKNVAQLPPVHFQTAPHFPIYMDYSATTPIDPRVADLMIPYLREQFGNPASRSHMYGWTAEKAVEEARGHVAALVNADPREIIWTSGATESNNLAIKGAAQFYKSKGKHIITVKTEHKAVLDTVRELERVGFDATYLEPQDNGLITVEQLAAAIRPDTILVSVMLVNNEIGVIQPIDAIGELCRSKGIIFHCDAAQATGKVVIDLQKTKVDLMTFTAHKTYGPKGMAPCTSAASRASVWKRRCTAAATSAAFVRARCQPTRSSAWAKPSASPKSRWTARLCASRRCATVWPPACKRSKKPISTATWTTVFRTTSTSASITSRANR